MALAVDAVTVSQHIDNIEITFAHTCSGVERFLVVTVTGRGSTFVTDHVTGVTYNGVAMTRSSLAEFSGGNARAYIYTLLAPTAGTHNVVISVRVDATSFYGDADAISFTGVDQGSPIYSEANESVGAYSNDGTFDLAISTPASGYAVGATHSEFITTACSVRDGATVLHNVQAWYGASSTSYKLNATSHGWNVTFSGTSGNHHSTAVIAIKASGVSVPDAPVILTASGGNTQASVPFRAGASDGGSPVTSFRAISTPGSFTSPASLVSPLVVTGLTNGTAYTFTVRATNANGNSAESAASNSVTPAAASGGKSIFASGIFGRN